MQKEYTNEQLSEDYLEVVRQDLSKDNLSKKYQTQKKIISKYTENLFNLYYKDSGFKRLDLRGLEAETLEVIRNIFLFGVKKAKKRFEDKNRIFSRRGREISSIWDDGPS